MKIGIDARMYGPQVGGGGLGRYVEQLVDKLQTIDNKNRYILFEKNKNQIQERSENFKVETTNCHWYTFKEQFVMPRLIDKHKLDLIHYPHWNVPLRCKTPFIVTIHDLILLEEPNSSKVSTRHPLIFKTKYQAYRHILKHALTKSESVICVSEHTKKTILKFFPETEEQKLHVIYEGVTKLRASGEPEYPPGYFLYVGNAYPHKNISFLLETFQKFHKSNGEARLILAGSDNFFYQKVLRSDAAQKLGDALKFIPDPNDASVANLLAHAQCFVFPSRNEGFGLPPLEALSLGTPVLASNAASIPEILKDNALYFNPNRQEELLGAMEKIYQNQNLQNSLVSNAQTLLDEYSWEKMTSRIQKLYTKHA